MERGLYIAASGMLVNQLRLDVVANNLANAGTAGYKGDRTASRSFGDMLLQNLEDGAPVGPLSLGAQTNGVETSFDQGALRVTDRELDLAISGNAFFAVETPDGVRYTRDGSFRRDADGYLVTAAGRRVLGESGPLRLAEGKVTVGADGTISVGGAEAGRLRLATLEGARKEGGGLLAGEPRAATGASVQQGYLEAANVDAVTQMVAMIEIMRSFESGQKAVQAIDETLQKAVNEVGRTG